MKSSLVFFLLFFSIINLSAQKSDLGPRNSVKYGYGTTFLGAGDYFGKLQYVEYNHTLFKPVSFSVDGAYTKASKNNSNGFQQSTKAYQGDANLFISAFKNDVNGLKFGGGGSYRKSEQNNTTEILRDSSGNIISEVIDTFKQESWGWSAMMEYEVFIADFIILGSRLMYQQYQNGDKVYFWGLNAGFRF